MRKHPGKRRSLFTGCCERNRAETGPDNQSVRDCLVVFPRRLVRARTALVNTAAARPKRYGQRLRGNLNPEKAEGLSPELNAHWSRCWPASKC